MCGIAGFFEPSPSESLLHRMLDAITHRGPDDSGVYVDSAAAIGMRRLSIVDLAGGHQPMHTEDQNQWIVYNGEVFNHAALRPDLERSGHRYTSRCDTETILHGCEEHGPAFLQKLRGMFAFAIWNRQTRTLFAARDRLGIKPFYYFWDGKTFAFASEIKCLLEHPALSTQFNQDALSEYLAFGYTSGTDTLFRGVQKLPPGHFLQLDLSRPQPQLHIEQYWDVPEPPSQPEARDDASWIAECRQRLEETVQMRLMADVPLGMFLSGGVDSSAIAALMKRMVTGPVKTFAVGYHEGQYSELGFARTVADSLSTEHHEVKIGMDEFFGALPKLVWHEDEPITWPSSISLYFVSRLAAKHVKVVLTGEGSDELFAGYERYRHHHFNTRWLSSYRVLPEALRRGIRSTVANTSLLSGNLRRKVQHTFVGREDSLESLYLDNFYAAFPASQQAELLSSSSMPKPYESVLKYWNARPHLSLLPRLLYTDQKTYLAELLMKQDQMSMACSIESRVPFLDHPFVEFAARVPEHLKLNGTTGKYILKKAIEDLLPREIIYRKKMGFPTPLRSWLRDPAAAPLYDLLQDRDGLLASLVNAPVLADLLTRHRNGSEDATDRIWRLLNLQVWGDLYITGRRSRLEAGLLQQSVRSVA